MSSPSITHITLSTGHARSSPRSEVADSTLDLLRPWLDEVVKSGNKLALPVPDLCHFAASATVEAGALVCTLWAPNGPHEPGKPAASAGLPMVTFGVTQVGQDGSGVWDALKGAFGASPAAQKPVEPWCGVSLHPSILAYPYDISWFGDFERCVAWAWITKKPCLSAI